LQAEIHHEHAVISYTKSSRHNTCVNYLNVFCGPDAVDRFAAPEKGWSDWPTREVTNNFAHIEAIRVSKCLPELFAINVRVCIHAHNQSIAV
jgi:hypothetical protein